MCLHCPQNNKYNISKKIILEYTNAETNNRVKIGQYSLDKLCALLLGDNVQLNKALIESGS